MGYVRVVDARSCKGPRIAAIQWWEAGIELGILPIGRFLAEQKPFGFNVAVDGMARLLVPADVEGAEFGKELQLAIWKMIVNPVGQAAPICASLIPVGKPRDHDACHCALVILGVAPVPYVARVVAFVRTAVVLLLVAKLVDRRRAICRTDRNPTESSLQGFQQALAECPSDINRKVRVVGNVLNAVEIGDFAV